MAKQQLITPSIATTGDTTGYMNVLSTTPGGEMQIVTTGGTVNTIGPDRHVLVGDMLVPAGHFKDIPTDLYVDGDVSIQKEANITIGDQSVENQGILKVDNELLATGDIDVQGDLIFDDNPSTPDDGIKANSADFTGWTTITGGPWSGLHEKQITFAVPFSDIKYSVALTPVQYAGHGGGNYMLVFDKLPTGFKIYTSNPPVDNESIDWLAIKY
jgi:hypothetical protein